MIDMNLSKHCIVEKSPQNKGDIILIHGFLSSPLYYNTFSKQLQSQGYNVIRCTQRGHGSRFFTSNMDEWDLNLHELDSLVNSLQSDNIILMGHSMGGTLAITEGIRNPKVKKVFAASAINNKHVFTETDLKARVNQLNDNYDKIISTFPSEYSQCTPENKRKFYLIHGKKDVVVPFSQFEANKKGLCIPDENTLVLDNSDKISTNGHTGILQHKKTLEFIQNHL